MKRLLLASLLLFCACAPAAPKDPEGTVPYSDDEGLVIEMGAGDTVPFRFPGGDMDLLITVPIGKDEAAFNGCAGRVTLLNYPDQVVQAYALSNPYLLRVRVNGLKAAVYFLRYDSGGQACNYSAYINQL